MTSRPQTASHMRYSEQLHRVGTIGCLQWMKKFSVRSLLLPGSRRLVVIVPGAPERDVPEPVDHCSLTYDKTTSTAGSHCLLAQRWSARFEQHVTRRWRFFFFF